MHLYSKILKAEKEKQFIKMKKAKTAQYDSIYNLGQLKASGYQSKSVKEEVRNNLIRTIQEKENPFVVKA